MNEWILQTLYAPVQVNGIFVVLAYSYWTWVLLRDKLSQHHLFMLIAGISIMFFVNMAENTYFWYMSVVGLTPDNYDLWFLVGMKVGYALGGFMLLYAFVRALGKKSWMVVYLAAFFAWLIARSASQIM